MVCWVCVLSVWCIVVAWFVDCCGCLVFVVVCGCLLLCVDVCGCLWLCVGCVLLFVVE